MAKKAEDVGSLKRLGGDRWQSRDDRFTIEPESGTWVVLDATQTDDLGLPLVRGPFRSLTAAKAAIDEARTSEPAISPLAAQVEEHRRRPAEAPAPKVAPRPEKAAPRPESGAAGTGAVAEPAPGAAVKPAPKAARPAEPAPKAARPAKPAPEPAWMQALEPAERDRAHALIARLARAGVPEPEELARQEIAEGQPAVAAFALARAIQRMGPAPTAKVIAKLLIGGEAPDFEVRWRLVDGEGRPITLD